MLFRTISKGRKGTLMPAFESKLNPEEIWKIIEYLREQNRQLKPSKNKPQSVGVGVSMQRRQRARCLRPTRIAG